MAEKRVSALTRSIEKMGMQDQRRHVLRGKRIVIVGAGYIGKKIIFDRAVELGVKIVLVDLPGTWAAPMVEHYLQVDTLDHDNAAPTAIKMIKDLNLPIDGICTFWENDTPLCGQIATGLGMIGNSYESCMTCRSKYNTRAAMEKAGLRIPAYKKIRNDIDLEDGITKVPFPAVLKPVFGAEAQGATKVTNAEEARAAYFAVKKLLSVNYDTIYSWGVEFILEQYLDGEEVDVDFLLFDGKVVFQSITDNLETNEPDFLNTASILPSILPAHKQQELTELAARTCLDAIGLTVGAIHVEMKYTSTGPQIIEVNSRMCGNPYFDWIRAVWGVCFIEETFMAVCGIRIAPFKPELPLLYLAGNFLLSKTSGTVTQEDFDKIASLRKDKRCFEVVIEVSPPHEVLAPPNGREELGWVTAKGNSVQQAVRNLTDLTSDKMGCIPPYVYCKPVVLPQHLREIDEVAAPPLPVSPAPAGRPTHTFAYNKDRLSGAMDPEIVGSLTKYGSSLSKYGSSLGAAVSSLGTSLGKSLTNQFGQSPRDVPRSVHYMQYSSSSSKQ
eukprot:CAMPEP_0184659736 /NCGR_PEP_ID=MMETSP0308-20130426/30845_1 /TAXON_ID=38269 /ORGANISM="Gloeochaete witrockiana, Strain SAG 46.84" /LENGTH=553 /DNA_ID=CAMNT_0027099787 /DNA_START=35 /DNA_END=1696 /DNA_ORIENTATION=+